MLLSFVALCATAVLAAPASAASASTLSKSKPAWYTAALDKKVQAAGPDGVQIPAEELNIACPGFQAAGVVRRASHADRRLRAPRRSAAWCRGGCGRRPGG